MTDERNQRSDAGVRRPDVEKAERFTIYIPGYGTGPQVVRAIENDLATKKKDNPNASVSTVILEWLNDYLGLKK